MDILVSIIVPVYKVKDEIVRCVDSIQRQTYKNLEIVLVDDGSPDECPQICDDYQKKDSRVKVIHKKNGGLSDARNEGLLKCNGAYVLFVDSDDYIEPDACEKLIAGVISEDSEIDIVVGSYKQINGNQVKIYRHTNLIQGKKYQSKEFIIKSIQKFEWFAPAWLNMYRRDFLLKNSLLYKKGFLYEDIEMLPRIFLSNPSVLYIDYPFYNYVIRDNSIMTSKLDDRKKQMSIDIFTAWYHQFQKVEDVELKRYLNGFLVKMYLWNAADKHITSWTIPELDYKFAIENALGAREKIKVIFFTLFPGIYSKIEALYKTV